jgi:hypothetical protein
LAKYKLTNNYGDFGLVTGTKSRSGLATIPIAIPASPSTETDGLGATAAVVALEAVLFLVAIHYSTSTGNMGTRALSIDFALSTRCSGPMHIKLES